MTPDESAVYQSALRRPSSFYEEPSVAVTNLLKGNVKGALQTFADPNQLSPADREDLADKVVGPGHDDSPFKKLIRIGTNPLVVLGLLASLKWPVGNATKRLQWAQSVEDYAKVQGPLARRLGSWFEIFPKPLSDWGNYIFRTRHEIPSSLAGLLGESLDRYEKRAGTKFTKETGMRIGIHLSGVESPDHPQWSVLRDAIGSEAAEKLLPEGFSPLQGRVKLNAHEIKLANDTRFVLEQAYGHMTDHPGSEAAVKRHLASIGITLPGLEFKENYWPQHAQLTKEEVSKMDEALFAKAATSSAEFRAKSRASMRQQVTKNVYTRRNATILSEEDLQESGLWTDRLRRIYAAADRAKVAAKEGEGAPFRRWSVNYEKTLSNYLYGVGRTVAWVVPPEGRTDNLSMAELFTKELEKYKAAGNSIHAKLLEDTYIPLLTGRMAATQVLPSIEFAKRREAALTWFKEGPGKNIPANMKRFLVAPLENAQDLSFHKVGGYIQDYIFVSTLGANTTSPAKNLMQHVTTTIPEIGPKYFFKGVSEVIKRGSSYFKMRREGIPNEEAFAEAFPEFAQSGLDIDVAGLSKFGGDRTQVGDTLVSAPQARRRLWEKFRNTVLMPFTWSERGNRLSAFYGSYLKGKAELPGFEWRDPVTGIAATAHHGSEALEDAAKEYAAHITRKTQFGGGPLGYPSLTVDWWGPNRQYTSFPMRSAGEVLSAFKTDWGKLGRMAAGAGLVVGAAKELFDQDISDSVMLGTMPSFGNSTSPWGVMPMVPPLWQGVGSVIQSARDASWAPIGKMLPLAVPLGLQLGRTLPTLGPVAASAMGMPTGWPAAGFMQGGQNIGRPYVDSSQPTVGGRYPVFRGDGSLVGYYSSLQLWAKAAGLGDLNGTKEMAAMKYLMTQRDKIRGIRRNYTEAIVDGDTHSMEQIDGNFQREYPGFGSLQLQIKKADIKAVTTRRQMARIDRMLKTLPAPMREDFAASVATSLGAGAPGFLGTDPMLMGNPTPQNENLPYATDEGDRQGAVNQAHQTGSMLGHQGMNAFQGYM